MLCATFRQDVVPETLGGLLVEDAVLLEYAEGIGVQNLRPLVTVIACGIASCHDVRELHGHAGVRQLLGDHRLLPCLFLEWDDVGGELVFLGVVCHVEETEAYLAQTSVGCHEVAALDNALYQLVWQWFASLVMEGESA